MITGFLKKLFGNSNKKNMVKDYLGKKAVVIDVRTPAEFDSGHYNNSKNIPLHLISSRIQQIKSFNKPIIVCCASGMRSGQAKSILERNGIEVINAGSWTFLSNNF
jgi:rhodanese-related sulfurtransferase